MLMTVLAIIGGVVVIGVILGVVGQAFGPDGTVERETAEEFYARRERERSALAEKIGSAKEPS